jgi:isocitrate dehydrogenase (NAD+)
MATKSKTPPQVEKKKSGAKQVPVTLIPGDGIGPEVTEATLAVLEAVGAPFTYEWRKAGVTGLKEEGDPLPKSTIESVRKTRLALKGPLATPVGGGFRSSNVRLREEFHLYANLRPARTLIPGGRYDNIDLILVRENLEGLYVGFEHYIPIGDDPHALAIGSGVNTRAGGERINRFAFDYAVQNGRKKVTLVHKANVLKALTGLFLETGRAVAKEYEKKGIACEDMIVDACAMKLVMDPWQFDVIVTTNLFGDILSDLNAGLVGGLGMAPAGNIGKDAAIFEAVHGSAPDIAGKGIANPLALMLSAAMMLDHVGEQEKGRRVRQAIDDVLLKDKVRTGDLKGKANTKQFTAAVVARVK